jgi:ABC-2 type transport system permease protein
VLVFGALVKGADNISVDVAVVNNSQSEFSRTFEQSLKEVKALKLPDKPLSLSEARKEMEDGELNGIIELPQNFGEVQNGMPTGTVKVYYDHNDTTSGDIVASILQSVVGKVNEQLVQVPTPLAIERAPLTVTQASPFDNIYSMFTAMSIMMVGVFAVASVFPTDKKTGTLRRLRVTPVKSGQVIFGTMFSFAVIGIIGVALLTIIAMTLYGFQMRGDWLVFALFVVVSLLTMLGFGLAIGGIAKNSTQADILGQVVFIASLALGGVWFPRALLPDFAQSITAFMPLTPIIEGIRAITTENAGLTTLWPQLAILVGWAVVMYVAGIKLFKWES